jgi:hypothetical protein
MCSTKPERYSPSNRVPDPVILDSFDQLLAEKQNEPMKRRSAAFYEGDKRNCRSGEQKRKKELIATYLQGRNVWPQDSALKELGDILLTAFFAEDHPMS